MRRITPAEGLLSMIQVYCQFIVNDHKISITVVTVNLIQCSAYGFCDCCISYLACICVIIKCITLSVASFLSIIVYRF